MSIKLSSLGEKTEYENCMTTKINESTVFSFSVEHQVCKYNGLCTCI